jgi:hypothetical protein
MKLALAVCAAAALTLVQSTFAATISQVYTFSFTGGNDYPSFSFSETFPDFVTSDGPLTITPVVVPLGFVLTQAKTCTQVGMATFVFATANIPSLSGCATGPWTGFGLEGGFVLTAYPTADGVYPTASTEFLGNGVGGDIVGLGSATVTIAPAVPEPASWILFSSAIFAGGLLSKRRGRLSRRSTSKRCRLTAASHNLDNESAG